MLRTIVDMTFLLLAVIIIVVLLKDARGRELVDTARNDIAIVKQETHKYVNNSVHYLETKVNNAEARQDSYQSSTSRRLSVLEQRLESLEKQNKQTQRIINNNINNNSLTNSK